MSEKEHTHVDTKTHTCVLGVQQSESVIHNCMYLKHCKSTTLYFNKKRISEFEDKNN